MKFTQTLVCILFLLWNGPRTQAALPIAASQPSPEVFEMPWENPGPPVRALRIAQMRKFVAMTPETYGKWRGKKLNVFEKLTFRISQRRMKKMLEAYDYGDPSIFQKIAWLLKGLLLGPIAVLLVYLFASEDERELIKWVWIGFAGWCVWVGILVFSLVH